MTKRKNAAKTKAKYVSRMVQKGKGSPSPQSKPAPAPLDPVAVEKDFFEILNYQRKQNNNLLGSFSGDKYQISKEFIDLLLALPKKFDRIEDNVVYAATVLNTFVLNFKIVMDIAPDFCKAQLFLIENENTVESEIKHLSQLDEFVEIYSLDFRPHFCEKWNIFYEDVQADLGELYHYLQLQEEENKFNKELVEILSQLYVVRMLALLDKLGSKTDKAKFEFKLLMEKHLSVSPIFASDFTSQKLLLDQILKSNDLFKEILKTDEGTKILAAYATPLKNIRDKTYPATVLEIKKEDKPQAKAKPAESKGKVKAKGGSPAKGGDVKTFSWKDYKPLNISGGGGISLSKPAAPKAAPVQEKPKEQSKVEHAKPVEVLPSSTEDSDLPLTPSQIRRQKNQNIVTAPTPSEIKPKVETVTPSKMKNTADTITPSKMKVATDKADTTTPSKLVQKEKDF